MELTIQIVNFRSRRYLQKCLFSISQGLFPGIEEEILVINNDKDPLVDITDELKEKLNLKIYEIGKNIGFGRAHNFGYEKSKGRHILFLNPDTLISQNSLDEMLKVFQKDQKIGIVGPLLVDSLGNVQPECFGSHLTPFSTIKKKLFGPDGQQTSLKEEIFKTDWVSGGAMLVQREAFKAIGGFDENYFMYFEDVDLCLRAKKQGLKVMVNPKARIFHESGRSFTSGQEKKRHYYASQNYYMLKHFGVTAAGAMKLLRLPYYIKNIYLKERQ